MADEVVALPEDEHFLRRLDEIDRLDEEDLSGHAAGPATRLRNEGKLALAAQELVVGLLHLLGGPGFQDRVLRVHDGYLQLALAE